MVRRVKLTSETNPLGDYIELNDFNGFLCTNIAGLGASRTFENLEIKNRSFVVDNKPMFRNFTVTVQILTPFAQFETKLDTLLAFLDRNKDSGMRLYVQQNPLSDASLRYVMCSLNQVNRADKRQAIELSLVQNSFWLTEQIVNKKVTSIDTGTKNWHDYMLINGIYAFSYDEVPEVESGYYAVSYMPDASALGKSIVFELENASFNEVPLVIKIFGRCVNPNVILYEGTSSKAKRTVVIDETVEDGESLEINSTVDKNGVYLYINGQPYDRFNKVHLENGSPFMYIGHGTHYLTISSDTSEPFSATVTFQEEYIA